MRVRYNDLVMNCDWAVRYKNKIVFGTRSRELLYAEFVSENIAETRLNSLLLTGGLQVTSVGVVDGIFVEKMSDLLMLDIFDDADFTPIQNKHSKKIYRTA